MTATERVSVWVVWEKTRSGGYDYLLGIYSTEQNAEHAATGDARIDKIRLDP